MLKSLKRTRHSTYYTVYHVHAITLKYIFVELIEWLAILFPAEAIIMVGLCEKFRNDGTNLLTEIGRTYLILLNEKQG